MRKRSTVLIHIFSQIHSKQRFYMYIRSLLSKTCSSGIVFGKFNQIYPCTFKNLTIFNVFYLRHVKRLGICLPRGRSRSIINIHEIVTSCWRIERCHRRRASGVRVKRDAGHTSLSKALVDNPNTSQNFTLCCSIVPKNWRCLKYFYANGYNMYVGSLQIVN